jgi:hypothetical protein
MPYDGAGNPRSGHGRARFADAVSSDKQAKKLAEPAKGTPPENTPMKKEEEPEMHMHTKHLEEFHEAGRPHPEPSGHSIEEHVAEHGPAHHAVMHHDPETGKIHVTTHHGEHNAPHHSVHDSHQAAAAHLDKAFQGEGEQNEEPFAGKETPEEEMAEAHSGKGIPGMGV